MKTLFLLILTLFIVVNVNAQENIVRKFLQQKEDEIKELEENVTNSQLLISNLQKMIRSQQDSLRNLRADISKIQMYKDEIVKKDIQINSKSDSIEFLMHENFRIKNLFATEEKNNEQKLLEEKEIVKVNFIVNIENKYKNKPFDSLIKTLSESSIKEDLIIIGQTSELKPLLTDLMTYFQAKELLETRFEAVSIKNAQNQLDQINQGSELVSLLKQNLENYQMLNDGLKQSFERIILLDQMETVSGMPEEIRERKLKKIIEITQYIFNYDFNLLDYPFLSDAIMEVIKRKQPNPDADISDILENL